MRSSCPILCLQVLSPKPKALAGVEAAGSFQQRHVVKQSLICCCRHSVAKKKRILLPVFFHVCISSFARP